MNQSFNMEPTTVTDSIIKRKCVQQHHVPPCEIEEMTKEQQAMVERYREQQAVVERYRERQDVKSKSTHSTKGPKLVYSVEKWKALELMVEEKCPIAQRDGYDTV